MTTILIVALAAVVLFVLLWTLALFAFVFAGSDLIWDALEHLINQAPA